jgi:hypothetical protein
MRLDSDFLAANRAVVLVGGSLFSGFSAAHLIDEFLWGTPAEFHLSVEQALLLAFLFITSLVGLVTLAGRGRRGGYLGLAIIGMLIGLADLLKHVPEILRQGQWRSGALSEFLALGLTVSALVTAAASIRALRRTRRTGSSTQ